MKQLYTIHDITADIYHAPFVSETDASAIRFFGEQINAGESNLSLYPDQYRLIRCGSFDPTTGVVETGGAVQLGTAAQFLINPQTKCSQTELQAAILHRQLLEEYFTPEELAKATIGPEQIKELECRIRGRQEAATDQNDIDIEETLNPKADLSNEAQLPATAKKPPKGE